MLVFEISFKGKQAKKMYVATESRKELLADLKISFGDSFERVRKLDYEEIKKLRFSNYDLACRSIRAGRTKTYILSSRCRG